MFVSQKAMRRTDFIPLRASKNRIYAFFYSIITHMGFITLITLVIIANTLVLALDKHPEDP